MCLNMNGRNLRMRTEEIVELFLPKGTDDLANVIGPQGNLIDKLDNFNTKFMLPDGENPLKVTKKWRWAPGTYDRVKKAYTRKVMQWHRRPRHMHSLFERRRAYTENDMKRELLDIERYLINARRDSAVWLDDKTDNGILEQVTAEFAYKIEQLYKMANAENDSFNAHAAQNREVSYWYGRGGRNDGHELEIADGKFILTINMPVKSIEVTREGISIGKVPFPALSLMIMIDVPRWISHSMSPQRLNERGDYQRYFNLSAYYEVPSKWFTGDENDTELLGGQHWPIFHPFIQSSGYHEDRFRPWGWRNVCWGSYGNEIINSFMAMDWNAFFLFIEKWLYQYEIIDANPLNNIRTSFLGIGADTSTEMLDIVGYRGVDCVNRLSQIFSEIADYRAPQYDTGKILNYCENVRDCTLRHKGKTQCIGYIRTFILHEHVDIVDDMIGDLIENPVSLKKVIHIHKCIRDHFELNSDYPYYGTERAYKRLFTVDKDLYDDCAAVFEGACFQMTMIDQSVVAYALINNYWDAYIRIVAFSYLMKGGFQLEKDCWDKRLERATLKVSVVFNNLIQSMTPKEVNQSKAQIEADNTREEMLKWANQVSSGRIVSNPFGERLEEDFEDSEPSI